MDLTAKNKEFIDKLGMYDLLKKIRFAKSGDPWMQGETGEYWMKKYCTLRDKDPVEHTMISKTLGW